MLSGGGGIAVSPNGFVSSPSVIFSPQFNLATKSDPFNPVQWKLRTSSPTLTLAMSLPSDSVSPLECKRSDEIAVEGEIIEKPLACNGITAHHVHSCDPKLVEKMVYDGLVWCSLHGLIVGDMDVQRSGTVPGVGMTHAPFSLIPMFFREAHFKLACELAPIFNELMDRVSLDDQFLQDSLSRTRKVDEFTSRLLDIHLKMINMNKREEIRFGLHRSDYMVDEQTKSLLQIEFNTISSSFAGLSGLVSDLHRNLLKHNGIELGLDFRKVPENKAAIHFVEALAKAWSEYNKPRAVIMVVGQPEERNMYDQHWLFSELKEKHGISSVRKTLAEIDADGELLPDGTLAINGDEVAVVYFRAGYTPRDYPSESNLSSVYLLTYSLRPIGFVLFYFCQEWRARLLIEQSCAIKCPSIAYHLAGTKKIQQELAKPNILERFLENKDEIALIRKCFAGLWSLDDSSIVEDAIDKPELYVMKPQREGGGNNIYGQDVRDSLIRLVKEGNTEDASAAYILMQRIFPALSPAYLVRNGFCRKDQAISELGIYGMYLRNKERVILNQQSGYLMRTKVASSNEGGVASGYAVLDSLYLVE